MVHPHWTQEKIEQRYKCTISVLYMRIYEVIRSFGHPIAEYELIDKLKKNFIDPNDCNRIIKITPNDIKVDHPIYRHSFKSNTSLWSGRHYYSWKSKIEMVRQLCENPDSLTNIETEIVGHNADEIEQDLLEKYLPHDHQVYYDLAFMSLLKNPIGIDEIKVNLHVSEKAFLDSFHFEIPYLPKIYFLRNNKETGFYAENNHIIYLRLSNKFHRDIDKNINDLEYLKRLELSDLYLKYLPERYGNLKSLQTLHISDQNLVKLPENFGNLINLKEFSIFSSIDTLPKSFGHLINLKKLNLWKNKIDILPESFGNLNSLEHLDLSNNQITSLPESFGNLNSLNYLKLSNNQITSLPESFGNLNSLEYLDLTENPLSSLYPNFGNLKKLKTLKLEHCRLITLPQNFENLKNLLYLDLKKNSIAFLPDNFGNLKKLNKLELASNNLTYLPESFKNLKNCKYIDLMDNQIRSLSNIPLKVINEFLIEEFFLTPKGRSLYEHYGNCDYEEIYDNQSRQINQYEYHWKILCKYYKKSPIILAQQYVKNPDSLTQDEKERLIHEANHHDRKYLEEYLPPDDNALKEISNRLKITLSNNLPLL